jgi:hypothetical protein
MKKSLSNTNTSDVSKNTSDVKVYGNPDVWVLICKASSESQVWMKSTKAMETGNGVVIQVSTQQGNNVAEAITFVPGGKIIYNKDGTRTIGVG